MESIYEILSKIGFDWQVALANLVNFLIILFLLAQFGFKPVRKIIQERQEKINKGLENAKKAETELMMTDIKKAKIIEEAQKKANEIMGKAKQDGFLMIENAKNKAKEEADAIIKIATQQNERDLKKMKKELEERNLELVLTATEKILREKMDDSSNEQYIKKVLRV